MSVQVSYKKQTLFMILLLLTTILLVEISLRIYEYITIPCGIFENDAFSNLSYFEIKNICYGENTVVHGKSPLHHIVPNQYKFTMNINSDGFRGNEIIDNNNFRVFFTGGSTAFGFGSTSDKTTIPGFLQEHFDNEFRYLDVEIINAGINGADSYREILLIKEKLIYYKPDLIISYTGVNDAGGYSKQIILDETVDDVMQNSFKFASYPGYRTPFVINNLINSNNVNYGEPIILSDKQMKKHSKIFKENWLQSCDYLLEKNITSIILLQPSLATKKILSNFEKNISINENRGYMLNLFSKELDVIDQKCNHVFDIRDAIGNTPETTYYDDHHVNDLGNKIIAEKIYEKILPIILKNISK
jgi:lysophospholipase L1-like esterase